MRKLAWAARGVAAVSGAVLAGALVAPSAVAHTGTDPKPPAKTSKQDSHKKDSRKESGHKDKDDKKKDDKQSGHKKDTRKESGHKKNDDKKKTESQTPVTTDGIASNKKCETSRDVDSAAVYVGVEPLVDTVFRAATDREGHAFLNDSRNPGVWINLALVPGAPSCVYDASVAATEEIPGHLYISLLAHNGTIWQAVCDTTETPFAPSTIAASCSPGFTALLGTPVGAIPRR
ncbi:hypothetical protein ABZ128_22530 [Streptomyces sp. NPDC006326]|uniref:hypothetical protein n=1 Tax=Streptomyces sp. NPDC006326 TaxID=3156752 RepID=UPI0033B5A734